MMEHYVYLDNAATTFPKPEAVYTAMDNTNRNYAVNAGRGAYAKAQCANEIIVKTKKALRKLIGADNNVPVVFCPSITVALNQIINGLELTENSFVYYSPYEHNAVARTLNYLVKRKKIHLRELPIDDSTGEIEIHKLSYMFSKENPSAVFCTHVSNVTGYVLPVDEIFTESKKYNSINVLDTAQSLGLVEYDIRRNKGVDVLAFAGHKSLYGPFGIGGFINISNIPLKEFIVGGTGSDSLNLEMPQDDEAKYECASSNIVSISGLLAALQVLNVSEIYKHEKDMTRYLVDRLQELKNIKLFAPSNKERHIGIVSFAVEGYKSEDVGMILDEDFNIAVRTGYHCAPFIHSHLNDAKYSGTVRVGISQFTKREEIDALVEALTDLQEVV